MEPRSAVIPTMLRPDMPTISTFYGIIIRMYWRDHAPPHFHACYAGEEALVEIGTLRIL